MKKIIIILLCFFALGVTIGAIFLFFDETQKLPWEKNPCIYNIYSQANPLSPIGVATYIADWQWITAWHVIQDQWNHLLFIEKPSTNPYIKNKPKLKIPIWFLLSPENRWNDIGIFYIKHLQTYNWGRYSNPKLWTWVSLELWNYCKTEREDGLWTYISGDLQKIPVVLSGTFIYYNPDYGQSGSPIFSGWKIIWIISRKYEGWAIISALD